MDRETDRQTVLRQVRREEVAVGLGVGLAQPILLGGVAERIDQRIRRLGLAAEGVHLQKIDLPEGLIADLHWSGVL